ncbi:MAG: hypothetical protein OEM60_06355 [Gammaproteobacteria bacterium]|nr:hypothetical protein [Gammaproteobacteria bacterium]MDH3431463.1 hypothetical protein [Gammaproteobacteria bacterium]MDH3433460.1 hypothetical protein [Gammaproteobacteria bacterium]
MKIRTSLIPVVVTFLSTVLSWPPAASGQEAFPDAPGRDTLILACTQCHSMGKMISAELSADDWEFMVYDMIARGAPVHQEDIEDLTRYLQDNFATDKQ